MRKIFFLAPVLIILSCQVQNEPPVINSINLTSSNIQKVEGAFLEFNYDFSDDSGLNQFRASVLDNFEDARLQSAPWNWQQDYNLSGTSSLDTIQVILPYPDLEIGRYELTITVQDIDEAETVKKTLFYIYE